MRLHSQLDLLPFVRAFLRQRPRCQNLTNIHHWKDLAKEISPFLLSTHLELPSNLAAWLRIQLTDAEDASAPSAADIPFVFHVYCENNNPEFLAALKQRQWTIAAKLASQHTLCKRLPFSQIYDFFNNHGEDKCQQYNIPMSTEPGPGSAAVRHRSPTDEQLRPLAKAMGLGDAAVYPHRYGLHDSVEDIVRAHFKKV